MHTHITKDDRAVIAAGVRQGESYSYIGTKIDKDKSAVCREVARNKDEDGVYRARGAKKRAKDRRRWAKYHTRIIEHTPELEARIECRLHPLAAPEVIAHDEGLTHKSIYDWIYRSRKELKMKLPQRGRKRRRYGSKREKKQGWTAQVRDISRRSAGADNRSRCGHLEGDIVDGQSAVLLTHTDRKSRLETIHRIPKAGADEVHEAVSRDSRLSNSRSITYDRGSAFALWRMIERDTGATVYFAEPHSPWQRGSNENANGRIRRIYPKGTDFGKVSDEDIAETEWIINHTKRKCLNWRTPCEVDWRCCNSG